MLLQTKAQLHETYGRCASTEGIRYIGRAVRHLLRGSEVAHEVFNMNEAASEVRKIVYELDPKLLMSVRDIKSTCRACRLW